MKDERMNVQTNFMMTFSDQRECDIDEEMIAFTHIAKKYHAFEAGLFNSKWFDYRFLTPFQATMLYIDAFQKVARRHYKQNFDATRAEHIYLHTGESFKLRMAKDDPKAKANFTGFWRGRQLADALGMPYETYIDLAIEFRLRNWQRAYLPRPCHLYNERDVEKIQARWLEIRDVSFTYSDLPAYMTQNYQGLRVQNDYHDHVVGQAMTARDPAAHLLTLMRQNVISYTAVEERVTAKMLDRIDEHRN